MKKKTIFMANASLPTAVIEAQQMYNNFTHNNFTLGKALNLTHQHYLDNLDAYLDYPHLHVLYRALEKSWATGDVHFLHEQRLPERNKFFDSLRAEFERAATFDYTAERSTPPALAGKRLRESVLHNIKDAIDWKLLPASSIESWSSSMENISLGDAQAMALFYQRDIPERYGIIPREFRTDAIVMKNYEIAARNIERYVDAVNDVGLRSGFGTKSFLSPLISDALTLDPGVVGTWAKELHMFVHTTGQAANALHARFSSTVNNISLLFEQALLERFKGTFMAVGTEVVPQASRKNASATHSKRPLLHNYPASNSTVVLDVWDVVTDVLFDHEDLLDPALEFSALLSGDGDHFVASGYAWRTDDFVRWQTQNSELKGLEDLLR